jgi:beta-glucosidase
MSANIEAILQSLTLDEKISLLAGQDFWQTVPVPEKGVPAIKVSHCLGACCERIG